MNSLLKDIDITLGAYDISLSFIYFLLIYIVIYAYKRFRVKESPEYKYFIIAFSLKVLGGFVYALLTIYYYKAGDTLGYYHGAYCLTDEIINNPSNGIAILLSKFNPHLSAEYSAAESYYFMDINSTDVLTVIKLATVFNFFGLFSFGTTTVLFSTFSFIGIWAAYSNFCKLYPRYHKSLLVGFFVMPTIIIMGGGILKDTVTLSCMGWLIYSFSNIFILKRRYFLSVVIAVIASIFIILIKPYILYVLLPSLLIWGQSNLKNLIKGSFIRIILIPSIVTSIAIGTFFVFQKLSSEAGRYSLENMQSTLEGFQTWHQFLATTENQSGYTLGKMDFSPSGYLKMAPAGFNVTFFRPYLWEIRNIPTLVGAMESFVLFCLFWYLLLKYRTRFFVIIKTNKDILFMLIFSTLFGIIVGISSYNFGALARYKMPAQMLFVTALVLIYNIARDERKGIFLNQVPE